jgi:CBS domain containing-hemolysin-like protein
MGSLILCIILCIILIGFFAGVEIAIVSVNKLNIELKKKQGNMSGRILSRFMENPAEFIGTSLIGVNIVLVVYGLLMTQLTEPFLTQLPPPFNSEYVKLFLDTLFATLIILVFGEFFPKAIFRAKAESMLMFFSVPINLVYSILAPVAKLFVAIAEWILKYLLNVKLAENKPIFGRGDLEHFVKQTSNGHNYDSQELNTELFENALYLVNVKIRECLVPRNEIEAIDIKFSVKDARERLIKTKLSKLVVYDENIDNIVGYLHHLDLHRNPATIHDVMHPIVVVPETMSAVDLMNKFTKERKSIAWVIDEFGGTAGIITMEDVLEEIFGDINDEHDTEEYVEKQLSENEFIFSGRLEVDYLNDKYDFDIPADDAETLSGYIVTNHETIPKMKERIIIDDFEFDILLVTETRIETVKMKWLNPKK